MNIKLLHGLQYVSLPLSAAVLQALLGGIILPKDLIQEMKWCHLMRAELEMSHTRDENHQQVPESAKKESLSFCKEEQDVGNDLGLFSEEVQGCWGLPDIPRPAAASLRPGWSQLTAQPGRGNKERGRC